MFRLQIRGSNSCCSFFILSGSAEHTWLAVTGDVPAANLLLKLCFLFILLFILSGSAEHSRLAVAGDDPSMPNLVFRF